MCAICNKVSGGQGVRYGNQQPSSTQRVRSLFTNEVVRLSACKDGDTCCQKGNSHAECKSGKWEIVFDTGN